jgi:tRNA threonylcarbamoyladenosine biosynthesis protein TsaE
MKQFFSTSTDQTLELGRATGCLAARQIREGMTIALKGDLGAGKTTFVQGLAKGFGVPDSFYITSPTFNIINEYPASRLTLCHIDLYRLGSVDELEYIGFEDLLDDTHLIIVEWPGLLEENRFEFDIEIHIKLDDNFNRMISFSAPGKKGEDLLSGLSGFKNKKRLDHDIRD